MNYRPIQRLERKYIYIPVKQSPEQICSVTLVSITGPHQKARIYIGTVPRVILYPFHGTKPIEMYRDSISKGIHDHLGTFLAHHTHTYLAQHTYIHTHTTHTTI